MCNNYTPSTRAQLRDLFDVEPPKDDWRVETWPDYQAPIIRRLDGGGLESVLANFGMVPKSHIPSGVTKFDTTNARSETVGEKRSFSGAWKAGQLAIVPAQAIFEPNYEHGSKSTRYRIWVKDADVFGIAGLWRDWPNGETSFTMLTLNADQHPLMNRMHAPGKEKRSVIVLPWDSQSDWLACRDPEEARSFLSLYPASGMDTGPSPVNRPKKESSE